MGGSYLIGAGDKLQIFVWRNAELSTAVQVRPDGMISTPLVDDLPVAGKTPTEAARAIEKVISQYVQNPVVTVMVTDFVGPVNRQIRTIGEAAKPLSVPYSNGITVLDVMIAAGGLTKFADGNHAIITRTIGGKTTEFRVRLDDLMQDGDLTANVELAPGDVLTIPQRWF